jgi:predicted secreted protein
MSTPGKINGSNLLVYIDVGVLKCVGYSTSCSISISHETRSTTNSTSGGWNSRMPGNRDWEVSVDAMVSMTDNANPNNWNFYTIYATYLEVRQVFTLRFGNDVSGDKYWEGNAYLTGMELNGSNEETATYSMTFIAAGPLALLQNP